MRKILIFPLVIILTISLIGCSPLPLSPDTNSSTATIPTNNTDIQIDILKENPGSQIDPSNGLLVEKHSWLSVSNMYPCKPGDAIEYTLSAEVGTPIVATYDADQNLISTILANNVFNHQNGTYVFSGSEVYFRIAGVLDRIAGYRIKYISTENIEMDCLYNPYADTNWSTVQKVCSVSHQHGTADATVQNLYNRGIRHIAMSNYYPSQPYYPYENFYTGTYDGLLTSPNAEHHNLGGLRTNGATLGGSCHICSVGSLFRSGSESGSEPLGYGNQGWKNAFDSIIDALLYKDAGGITINHPEWSKNALNISDIFAMLDYSTMVLGIEIYNQTCEDKTQNGWALNLWDEILLTGRKCWGFCVADHGGESSYAHPAPAFSGRNVLLVDNFTEYDCLKAYTNGNFYGKLNETDFHFNNIEYNNGNFSVSAPGAEYINIIIDGVYTRYEGSTVSVAIPYNSVYIRAEAHRSDDSLFTNPVIFRENKGQG